MEIIKPGQFVEATYDLFVGAENELMERATKELPLRFVFGADQMLPSFEAKLKDDFSGKYSSDDGCQRKPTEWFCPRS